MSVTEKVTLAVPHLLKEAEIKLELKDTVEQVGPLLLDARAAVVKKPSRRRK